MKKWKIAVTCKDSSKLWSNGLTQNAYNLIKLLKKIGYEVDPVSFILEEIGKNIEEFEVKLLAKHNITKYNIIIEVCYSLGDSEFEYAKKNGVKVVTINYGNLLMLMQEDLILNPEKTPAINRRGTEGWISPHFEFSKGFIETTSKSKVEICPYIWSPDIFLKFCNQNKLSPFFNEDNDVRKIGIFEANINVLKTFTYPLISLEKLERKNSSLIKEVLLFNGIKLKENKKFKESVSNLNLQLNKKLSVEERFALPVIFSKKYIGSIVSHQFYCDLNYLTLEGLYCGFPVIHNSEFCKEAGYFYPEFNADECANKIEESILSHKDNLNDYKQKAKEVIFKFSADNLKNIKKYKYLLENIS